MSGVRKVLTAAALTLWTLMPGSAQQLSAPATQKPAMTPRPPVLFSEKWQLPPHTGEPNDENMRFTPAVVTNPRVEVKLYGLDAKVIRAAVHEERVGLWTGMASSPVAITLRDRNNYIDLTDAADLARYGLDKPAGSVRIGSGSSQATLLLGSKAEEATIYAKDGSRPAVFTVEATLLETPLPPGDGTGGREQDGRDGAPGIAFGQQQQEVGAACDFGVGAAAVQVQQRLAVSGGERDSGVHGLVSEVPWLVLHHSPYRL